MKILVGSLNPVKIKAVETVFGLYFKDISVLGVHVTSDVPAQPKGDETFDGAKNRAEKLRLYNTKNKLGAEYFVGIEGGISEVYGHWFAFGAMCILASKGDFSFGMSPHFELPEEIVKELLGGIELGDVMDRILQSKNTKRKNGAIGFFTNGKMNRRELYEYGLLMAMVPFLHTDLYFGKKN